MKLEAYWKVHLTPRRLPTTKGTRAKYVIVIKGPFEVTVACETHKPTVNDMRCAQWTRNALNWAKQRTEEILEEQFGPDDSVPLDDQATRDLIDNTIKEVDEDDQTSHD